MFLIFLGVFLRKVITLKKTIFILLIASVFACDKEESFDAIPFREPCLEFGCDTTTVLEYEERELIDNAVGEIHYKGENKYIIDVYYWLSNGGVIEPTQLSLTGVRVRIHRKHFDYMLQAYINKYGTPESHRIDEEEDEESYGWTVNDKKIYILCRSNTASIDYTKNWD